MTGRIRRAWAVLRGKPDAAVSAMFDECAQRDRLIASLRASLDDANAVIARLSAEAKARNDLTRDAHALLGTAITDDRGPTL